MKHAGDFIRPSSIAALAICSGRAQMEAAVANLVEERQELTPEEAKEAELGAASHTFLAATLTAWQIHRGERRVLDIAIEHLDKIPTALLDRWTRWCIRWCAEYVQALIDKHRIDPEDLMVEQHLDGSTFGIGRGGTADLVLVIPYELVVVVDYKMGFLDQGDADDHDQLAAYACMAAQSFRCQTVIVHLLQPRAERDQRQSAAKFNADTIRQTAEWMRDVATRARDPEAELSPCYDACKYCSALPLCPAVRSRVMRAKEAVEMIEPSSAEDWGRLLDDVKMAGKWAEDAYEIIRAHRQERGPGSVAGWKLRAGRKQSKVRNPKEALARAAELGLLELFADTISVSAPKLLAMSDEHRSAFAPLVEEQQTKASLVKGSE